SLDMTAGTLSGAGGTVNLGTGLITATSALAAGVPTGSPISVSNLKLDANMTVAGDPGQVGALLNGFATDLAISSSIQDGATSASVTKTGQGSLQYTNMAANTYTGGTFVNDGRLLLHGATNSVAGDLTIGDGTGTGVDLVRLLLPNQIADTATVHVE